MNILLTGAFKYSKEQMNDINSLGYKITFVQDERVSLDIDVSDIDVVVCNSLFLYNDISQFKNLKLIQLTSAGMERIPLDYIKKHDIQVENAKGIYSIPMAEWTVLKILEIYKDSRHFYKAQNENKWIKNRSLSELYGKTATIIGFGDIGSEIAIRLKAFGVKIIGIGRREIKTELTDEYYLIRRINEALKKSDIVILTLPLTNVTKKIFGKEELNNMKEASILINISRGELIDEAALVEAIQSNKFLGVALDVFEEEPLRQDSPLWKSKKVLVSPHNSFVSDNINHRLFGLMMENLNIKEIND